MAKIGKACKTAEFNSNVWRHGHSRHTSRKHQVLWLKNKYLVCIISVCHEFFHVFKGPYFCELSIIILFIFFFYCRFYGPLRLFDSFWAKPSGRRANQSPQLNHLTNHWQWNMACLTCDLCKTWPTALKEPLNKCQHYIIQILNDSQ